MHHKCATKSNVLRVLLLLSGIATFYYVEAQMKAVYTTQECRQCLDDGFTTCRSARNNSISYCCDPNVMDTDECAVDFDKLRYPDEAQHFDFCSSQVWPPSMEPYVCPYEWQTCSSTPCGGMVEGDPADPEKGCTFSNPKVLSACEFADQQEFFAWPCREGYDTYSWGVEDTYSDATTVGEHGYTWAKIKRDAMAPGYN